MNGQNLALYVATYADADAAKQDFEALKSAEGDNFDTTLYPDFDEYLEAGGREAAVPIIEKYQAIPDYETAPEFYCDWGVTEPVALSEKKD